MSAAKIQPIKFTKHTCKQGHYGEIVPQLPMRSMLVGPSGGGKAVLLTHMLFDIYKGCFSRVFCGHQVYKYITFGSQ